MSGPAFVNFYSSDWRSGCIGLSLDQEGLYIRMCAFEWETRRRVPLDDRDAASALVLNPKNYRRVRDELLAKGKIIRHADGYGNDRAEAELVLAQAAYAKKVWRPVPAADMGAGRDIHPSCEDRRIEVPGRQPARAEILTTDRPASDDQPGINRESIADQSSILPQKTEQNQGPFIEPELELELEGTNVPLSKREASTLPSKAVPEVERQTTERQPIFEAFQAWQDLALRVGLPQARTLTPALRKAIGARLREHKLNGWREMLAGVEGSSFLRGRNDRGFRCDLGWCAKPEKFERILSGMYEDRGIPHVATNQHPVQAAFGRLADSFSEVH